MVLFYFKFLTIIALGATKGKFNDIYAGGFIHLVRIENGVAALKIEKEKEFYIYETISLIFVNSFGL